MGAGVGVGVGIAVGAGAAVLVGVEVAVGPAWPHARTTNSSADRAAIAPRYQFRPDELPSLALSMGRLIADNLAPTLKLTLNLTSRPMTMIYSCILLFVVDIQGC